MLLGWTNLSAHHSPIRGPTQGISDAVLCAAVRDQLNRQRAGNFRPESPAIYAFVLMFCGSWGPHAG
jgi:hypothetical protein